MLLLFSLKISLDYVDYLTLNDLLKLINKKRELEKPKPNKSQIPPWAHGVKTK